ncbi:hypothetical protein I3842_03G152600 [Carya illinoinensis]|uniref:Uncharacterized protein n=1 Tax=Carya illinoinensis TaxID=32201 RepID=A0A922JZY3_CARIL|nr:hypothetical protein I3842_03G152600 [Carya illinoinensis]
MRSARPCYFSLVRLLGWGSKIYVERWVFIMRIYGRSNLKLVHLEEEEEEGCCMGNRSSIVFYISKKKASASYVM